MRSILRTIGNTLTLIADGKAENAARRELQEVRAILDPENKLPRASTQALAQEWVYLCNGITPWNSWAKTRESLRYYELGMK